MSENRLDILETEDSDPLNSENIKINSIKLSNYRFFYGDADQNNKQ